jgi:hypothetical protein
MKKLRIRAILSFFIFPKELREYEQRIVNPTFVAV